MNKENWLNEPGEWQFVDPTNGFIFPGLTLDFLEHLITFDVSKWRVFESGSGASTLWWASKCKHITTLETRKSWVDKIKQFAALHGIDNIDYNLIEEDAPSSLDSTKLDSTKYVGVLENQSEKFDAIIVDGYHRDLICIESIKHLKEGGIIIADNYQQEGIWMAESCSEILNNKYPIKIFKQSPIPNPENHPWIWEGEERRSKLTQGHPHWKTAYWK